MDEYIYWVMGDVEESRQCDYGKCDGHQRAITALIRREGKAAVAPFFDPLDVSYFRTLSFFSDPNGGGTFEWVMEKGIVHFFNTTAPSPAPSPAPQDASALTLQFAQTSVGVAGKD